MKMIFSLAVCGVLLGMASASVIGVSPWALGAPALVRAPQHDSAIIQSDRVGGNFAYSTVEGHAYAAVQPIVQHVVRPVAVSYSVQQLPLSLALTQPAPWAISPVLTQGVLSPVWSGLPVATPIAPVGPVGPGAPVIAPAGPVADAPVQVAPLPGGAPQESPASDDDTVAIESA